MLGFTDWKASNRFGPPPGPVPALPQEEGVQVLQGEELAGLVHSLKLKWQSLNKAYVRLPCVVDTPSKRRRKEASRGAHKGQSGQGACVCLGGWGGGVWAGGDVAAALQHAVWRDGPEFRLVSTAAC